MLFRSEDVCDVGWILVHLNIPISANVRIFVDLSVGEQRNVYLKLALDLALPDHHGLPHLTNLRCCTYAVDPTPSCFLIAPNFAFLAIWDDKSEDHYEHFMLPFLRRVAAAGAIEDLSIVCYEDVPYIPTSSWNEIFGMLGSLRKLRLTQLQDDIGFPVWELVESQLCPTLRALNSRASCLVENRGKRGRVIPWRRNWLVVVLSNAGEGIACNALSSRLPLMPLRTLLCSWFHMWTTLKSGKMFRGTMMSGSSSLDLDRCLIPSEHVDTTHFDILDECNTCAGVETCVGT